LRHDNEENWNIRCRFPVWEKPGIQTAFCLGTEKKLAFISISKMHKTLLTREKNPMWRDCRESIPPTTTTTTLRRLRHGNEERPQAHQANRVRTETAVPPPNHSREEEPQANEQSPKQITIAAGMDGEQKLGSL
jgi:hypothetical protein